MAAKEKILTVTCSLLGKPGGRLRGVTGGARVLLGFLVVLTKALSEMGNSVVVT